MSEKKEGNDELDVPNKHRDRFIFRKRRSHRAIFLVKEHGTFSYWGKKKIKPRHKYVRFKGKSYPIEFGKPTWRKGNKMYYFFDIFEGQLTFAQMFDMDEADPVMLEMLYEKGYMESIIKNMGAGRAISTLQILLIVLSLLGGFGIGYIIGAGGYF